MDVGFMKVDPDGGLIRDTLLYHNGTDFAKNIVVDANGDYVFASHASVQSNNWVYVLAKYRKWNQVVGIKENQPAISGIKLYPNPAIEQVLIESEKPLTGTYSLYNLQSQKLWQETVWKSTQKVIPLQKLAPGIYIIRFVSENGIQFSRKIVKQ